MQAGLETSWHIILDTSFRLFFCLITSWKLHDHALGELSTMISRSRFCAQEYLTIDTCFVSRPVSISLVEGFVSPHRLHSCKNWSYKCANFIIDIASAIGGTIICKLWVCVEWATFWYYWPYLLMVFLFLVSSSVMDLWKRKFILALNTCHVFFFSVFYLPFCWKGTSG